MGIAYVSGLQGPDLAQGVVATGKHFLGYGASEGGMNWAPAHIPRRELLEVYLAPFAAAIKEAGLASIMNAYSEIDGIPVGASKELLTDLLRGELGFDGVVVSDYFTVPTLMNYHRIAVTRATRRAAHSKPASTSSCRRCSATASRCNKPRARDTSTWRSSMQPWAVSSG